MSIIADLHIHSKYSRAVSQKMNLEEIARWASIKGIKLVATGDWTHPLWFREIADKLKETHPGSGIFCLKNPPIDIKNSVYFILSLEISSIYSQGDKVRRIHNVILSPSINTCKKIIESLEDQGAKLMSDGRPIVGITAKDLLKIILDVDEKTLLIPAHIWTPWFSLFGSKSGFDSIKECFGDLEQYIYGIETGLSSDPIMNWQIKELETRSILSSSDAHSGPKLGREATVFVPTDNNFKLSLNDVSFEDFSSAIKQDPASKLKIGYTLEFFPEEGKYHWSGHRSCGIRYTPKEVVDKGIICPVCHRPLTIGVENRVVDLSKKVTNPAELIYIKNNAGVTFVYDKDKKRRPFVSLVPLLEVLTEINNDSPTKALAEYERLTTNFATEFDIFLKASYEEIEKAGGTKLRQAVQIIRERKVYVDPGYDGVFGKVKIFNEKSNDKEQKTDEAKQQKLF